MESIEKRKVLVGKQQRPSLHKDWVRNDPFLPFQALPASKDTGEQVVDWLISTDLILDDLDTLLNQPCHVFWSHLIFDDSLRANLDGFLKLSSRELDGEICNSELLSQNTRLYQTYLRVFIRMTTCKESAEQFFDPQVFGSILYDNFILDLPKIVDICSLFCPANQKLITKMVENVFRHQPQYMADVESAVPSLVKLFEDLTKKFTDDKLVQPQDLSLSESMADIDIQDLSLYASDMCYSLYTFLDVFPPACLPFHNPQTYKVLSTFYEDVLCKLLEKLDNATLSEGDEKRVYSRLQSAQELNVKLFRQILSTSTLGNTSESNSQELVKEFYDVLTESLGDIRFIGHYASLFPFEEDLQTISKLNITCDTMRREFIQKGLDAALTQRTSDLQQVTEENKITSKTTQANQSSPAPDPTPAPSAGAAASTSEASQGGGHTSAVNSVAELFPDLGAGFIEMCLRHYHSTEDVVSALLEDTLPESLRKLPRTLKTAMDEDTIVNSRKSVFDNDEFDVFRKSKIDTSRMHRGKRTQDLHKADASQKEKIKELVTACDEMSLTDNGADLDLAMYDDEYDDTYDSNEVGADDADEALELMGRKMVVPVALGGTGLAADEASEADKNGIAEGCQQSASQPPRYDVKGRAKGQGQSADVIRNRNYKTAHKARTANHNRKAGARSKMNKGMF